MSTNKENFEEYLKKVGKFNRGHLASPLHEPTIAELVAEGMILLEQEEKEKKKSASVDEKPRLEKKLGSMSKNPYVRARVEVLNGMSNWNRNEIERMEKTGNIENAIYKEFCHRVRVLADTKYPS